MPPRCSFDSAKGPSVVRTSPSDTRTTVAVSGSCRRPEKPQAPLDFISRSMVPIRRPSSCISSSVRGSRVSSSTVCVDNRYFVIASLLAFGGHFPLSPALRTGLAEMDRCCRAAKPLEAVEDQVEPELELVREVVSGFRDVLGDRLGDVGILVGGELAAHVLRRLCKLPGGVDRQGLLLERKAVDVCVLGRVGVDCVLDREAGLAQTPEDRIDQPEVRGSGARPRLQQADCPAMAREGLAGWEGPPPHP